MNRRAAAQARRSGTGTAADRPRQRRCAERAKSPALVRSIAHGMEVRDTPPADSGGPAGWLFRGYASVTETPYDMWDMFGPYTETIAASAFEQTLAASPDVAFLLNHGGMTLARTVSGTLTLSADDTGLLTEARLDPRNPDVQRIQSGVDRGDLSEMSFAFTITNGSWSPDYSAYRIEAVDLHKGDVSIVNFGANPDTFLIDTPPADDTTDDALDALDVDALDDAQALALAGRLQQRARRGRGEGMTRAELDALTILSKPHPLADGSSANHG